MNFQPASRWDIFCHIIDNYGDIGICWRLARQLAHEHSIAVRLWVDQLDVAKRLIPSLDTGLTSQMIEDVEICHWQQDFPDTPIAEVVIEAFACELPQNYLTAMAKTSHKPVWLNLEYLSAEHWVDDYHLLCSPHPSLPLTKYFFFPGFAEHTGGLIREKNLVAQRNVFQNSSLAQSTFWQRMGVTSEAVLKISLFCYADAPITDFLDTLVQAEQAALCLVPESIAIPVIAQYFGVRQLKSGDKFSQGKLTLQILPFLPPEDYDQLLWACDLNFLRGEDSWVRALWAARPFIWQPYRQQEEAHLSKLHAFLERYCIELNPDSSEVLRTLHVDWCNKQFLPANWRALLQHLPTLQIHATTQANQLAKQHDLATKLTVFCKNKL
jgi:uncharacterized repeat protein (TIGR03837 family)